MALFTKYSGTSLSWPLPDLAPSLSWQVGDSPELRPELISMYSISSIIRTPSIIRTTPQLKKFSKFHCGLTLTSDEAAPPSPRSVIVSQEARGVSFLCRLDRVNIAETVKFLRNR